MIDIYKKLLGLEKSKFSQVKHDDAMVAVVYHIETENGTELILKICDQPAHYLREIYFLKQFKEILPVPHIVNIIEPNSTRSGAILMQYLPGNILRHSELNASLAYASGAYLAQIHLQRTKQYGDVVDADSLDIDRIKYFAIKFDEALEECKDNLSHTTLNMCRKYYDEHINILKQVDGPCIIHRDFRPGNIIVKDNTIRGIIDWSSARYGFAEDDFCPMELGEWGANSIYKPEFLAGYASIRPVPDYAAVMPLLRLNRVLATIGFTVKRGTWNNSNAPLYKTNCEFLNNFFNLHSC